jgi:hypothetical protein
VGRETARSEAKRSYRRSVENEPLSQASHTRVPNLVSDVVLPLLTPAERDCLHYVIRRTYGFADPAGGRKARDTISLEQFENGISSGNYLLDLGTQLSRNTIRKALAGLEDKGLVEVRYSCTNCFWEQRPDQDVRAEEGRAPACPRCRASLSRSWALAELTPRKLLELLNSYDRKGREWSWDPKARRFRWRDRDQEAERRRSADELKAEAERLRGLLWYPELVDKAVALAEAQMRSGRKISLTRLINGFYKPVWELQEEFVSPPLVRYALEQTIKGPALRQADTHRWYRYLEVVARNARRRFGQDDGQPPESGSDEQLRDSELEMRELLRRAAELNGRGESEAARALLADILAQVDVLVPLFAGDRQRCENSLREAFKRGASDFIAIEPKVGAGAFDFYPEWRWPDKD